MALFDIFRILHIIGGFIALFVFWIPIVTKKGGKIHIISGWVYVTGMVVVSVSALYMGVFRILDPASSNDTISFSIFLIFIAILSSSTAFYGIRVLRFKNRKDSHRHIADLGFSILLLISSIFISTYGFIQEMPLLSWFPFLGIFLAATQLKYWLRKPSVKMHWWFEHLSGMIGCSISTITAFSVFAAPRLLNIDSVNILLWFLPTIFLTPVIIGFSVYYHRKFNSKRKNISV
ncbi:DUF2306 domain-containing protein [Bacillus dakarensis]|uniref:DUF2306 domain-containing protein n=1 Tax=Robertmurraya dakarensis TaxID=1926278 RepID=UPI000981B07A|nr:DUF2306 domain-containing protein [Bacillus dakarensis]